MSKAEERESKDFGIRHFRWRHGRCEHGEPWCVACMLMRPCGGLPHEGECWDWSATRKAGA